MHGAEHHVQGVVDVVHQAARGRHQDVNPLPEPSREEVKGETERGRGTEHGRQRGTNSDVSPQKDYGSGRKKSRRRRMDLPSFLCFPLLSTHQNPGDNPGKRLEGERAQLSI